MIALQPRRALWLESGGQDITGLDELAFNDADADATAVRRLRATNQHLEWHDATGSWPLQGVVGGGIFGLTLSNNVADATNDIDIAVGQALDDTEVYTLRLTTALIKRLDAVWAVGTNQGMLDTGAIANDTYHIYIIKRSDTGVTDVLASLSATAPTMPTSYDFRRRIGSIIRASAAIVAFEQRGDEFLLDAPVNNTATTNPGTAAVTETLAQVPAGIAVRALITFGVADGTPAGTHGLVTSPDQTDTAPSTTIHHTRTTTAGVQAQVGLAVRTNTSRQIRYRMDNSDGSLIVRIVLHGWLDTRGRDS